MPQPESFARLEILAQCLDAIQSGELTVEECLARHPEVTGLAALLTLALSLPAAEAAVANQSFPAVRQHALERRLIQVMDARNYRQPRRLNMLSPLAAAAAILLVLAGMLFGLARVSRTALPGDAMYGYKRVVERAEVNFASAAARPALLRAMAESRLDELSMVIVRDQRAEPALLDDVASSVNEAINAQTDGEAQRQLYDRAQQVFAFAASTGVTEAAVTATTINTPIPQPTAVITSVTVTPTTPTLSGATDVPTPPPPLPTMTATLLPTEVAAPTEEPTAVLTASPVDSATGATNTPRTSGLVTATPLPTFTPRPTQTAAIPTETAPSTFTPSATSLLPTPMLPTLSPEQLTSAVVLTATPTFAFTFTPIGGLPTLAPATDTPDQPFPPTELPPPTQTPTEIVVILPPCPTETATPTATLEGEPTLLPTETWTPFPPDFTPTATMTPPPCATSIPLDVERPTTSEGAAGN